MPIGLPIDLTEIIAQGENSPLILLKAIISDYFSMLGKPKWEIIFNRRLNEEENTLDSIAEDYQVTRERIRQIYQEHYDTITALLSGKTINKPLCCVHPHVLNWIYGSADFTKTIILKGHLMDIMGASIDDEDINGYLDLMMQVKNFHRQSYRSMEFYVSPKANIDIGRICKEIIWYLKKCSLPVSLNEISVGTKVMPWMIRDLEVLLTAVLKTDDGRYYLPLDDLYSYGHKAYRVLSEAGKPLHFTEINEKVGLGKDAPSGYMIRDSRLVSIGRSGNWALREWSLDDRSLTEVIESAIDMIGKPTTVHEITKCVKIAVPDATLNRVDSHIRMSPKKFCWTANRKICLVSWGLPGTLSKKPLDYEKRCPVPINEFTSKLQDAMGDQELSQVETTKLAKKLFPEIKSSTLSWRVYFNPGLIKENRDGMNYYKVNKSYVPKVKNPRGQKTEELIKDITDILNREGKKKRSDLIRMMADKGYSKPLVFKTLLKHPGFSVKVLSKKITMIGLNK